MVKAEGGSNSNSSSKTMPKEEEQIKVAREVTPQMSSVEELQSSIDIEKMEEEPVIQSGTSSHQLMEEEPAIQMVTAILRQIEPNKNCFDPVLVSLGPFHHGKPHLQPMEKYKHLAMRRYTNFNNDLEAWLYHALYDEIKVVKGYYYNPSSPNPLNEFTNSEFEKMMFVDACFVLDFINDTVNSPRGLSNSDTERAQGQGKLRLRAHQKPLVVRDMLLLENQIPFSFLKTLVSVKEKPMPREVPKSYIPIVVDRGVPPSQMAAPSVNAEPLSLIEKFIEKLAQIPGQAPKNNDPDREHKNEPVHILERFRMKLLNIDSDQQEDNQCERNEWYSFRSVTELKAAGIKFSKSSSSSLQDIKFKSNWLYGTLFLPPIVIDDSTKYKFLNMIAHEMCPNGPTDNGITSYICFLDSLIDTEGDVRELRSKNILLNSLGSDQEVADLFNVLSIELTPDSQAYAQAKKGIEKHCKTKWKVSLANLYHTHFNSPWTAAAFIAALFLLVLTFTQTYFTIYPRSN